jgi:hypothetical protein
MPTRFAATYLFSAFPPFIVTYGLTAPKNNRAEIIKIDFAYLEMLCTGMWYIILI